MSGEQAPKRLKTEDGPEPVVDAAEAAKVQKIIDAVMNVEEEIEKEDNKLAKEVLKIETKYNKAKEPTYAKRAKLLQDIPHFWQQALHNHPVIGHMITAEELKVLDFVTNLNVTYTDDFGSFKIELTLKENPFLASTSIWKQITFADEDVNNLEDEPKEPEVTASPLEWKDSAEATAAKAEVAFLEWFESTDGMQDLAEIIKDDLFKGPVSYYMNDGDDDDSELGSEDDNEEDDEENEEDDEENADKAE